MLLFEVGSPSGAWAACDYEPGAADLPTTQFGTRRLSDEVAAAYLSWLGAGAPGHQRYGITVDAESIRIWLDTPQNIIGEPLSPGFLACQADEDRDLTRGASETPPPARN